jgi:hypothetical protein
MELILGGSKMTISDQIYTLVKILPQDDANEILTFAEFIKSRRENGVGMTAPEEAQVSWTELVCFLARAWSENFPGLETIR